MKTEEMERYCSFIGTIEDKKAAEKQATKAAWLFINSIAQNKSVHGDQARMLVQTRSVVCGDSDEERDTSG